LSPVQGRNGLSSRYLPLSSFAGKKKQITPILFFRRVALIVLFQSARDTKWTLLYS
jgi:hypothetical protein